MTSFFKGLLGLCVAAFCIFFVFTIIWWLVHERVPSALLWADFISFTVAILCFPCITLSEAKRTRDGNKKRVKENGHWSKEKEEREAEKKRVGGSTKKDGYGKNDKEK